MLPPNSIWNSIIQQAQQDVEILKRPDCVKNVQNILQTNVSVCSSLGSQFVVQLNRIFMDMLSVYKYDII